MYVKKITSFCQVLKRCTQKKTGSFFLLPGVHIEISSNNIRAKATKVLVYTDIKIGALYLTVTV